MLVGEAILAGEYVKAHAKKIRDIMTTKVVSVHPNDSIRYLVDLMEKHAIKRLPVVENDRVVGVASRADLIRAFAELHGAIGIEADDRYIREKLLTHLANQPWAHLDLVNINVTEGVVELTGLVRSDSERSAIRVAAESMWGVKQVVDRMTKQLLTADL